MAPVSSGVGEYFLFGILVRFDRRVGRITFLAMVRVSIRRVCLFIGGGV